MADMMPKKSYDLTEITRLLLEMRENCIPKAGNAYEDPNRAEKYDTLNAAIDLINNPSMLSRWISVKDRLPEHGFVLVWCAYTHSVEIAKYKGSLWRTQERRYALNSSWVTHWMPLPEPPKE